MKVTCKHISLADIVDERLRQNVNQSVHQPEIDLVPGRQYPVFGVAFREGVPWFYLCEDDQSDYPVPYCAVFFQLDDMTIPNNWTLQWDGRSSALVPRWWAEVPDFLERLVDGDEEARQVFLRARTEFK